MLPNHLRMTYKLLTLALHDQASIVPPKHLTVLKPQWTSICCWNHQPHFLHSTFCFCLCNTVGIIYFNICPSDPQISPHLVTQVLSKYWLSMNYLVVIHHNIYQCLIDSYRERTCILKGLEQSNKGYQN